MNRAPPFLPRQDARRAAARPHTDPARRRDDGASDELPAMLPGRDGSWRHVLPRRTRSSAARAASCHAAAHICCVMRMAVARLLMGAWLVMSVTILLSREQAHGDQWPWSLPLAPVQQPPAAVVRVTVEEADGMAHGSGTLVDVRDRHGLVVTNWHVVRDATGGISVSFPNGFRSAARVLHVDPDWDLAALLIWRPNVTPIPLARQAPQPGELLTIAGYGSGNFRAVSGRCTQYVAPSDRHPFEMVEVSARARQGDSGGPILNAQGELAGVLFGSGGGTTSGSYAGRVHRFISAVWPPASTSGEPTYLASAPRTPTAHPTGGRTSPSSPAVTSRPPAEPIRLTPLPERGRGDPVTASQPTESLAVDDPAARTAADTSAAPPTATTTTFTWQELAGDSLLQQAKTFLALLGLFTLLAHGTRFLAAPREG